MKLYISGPMTGHADLNKPAFNAEAARLKAMGFEVVNPAAVELGADATWLDYMRADLKQMLDCDGLSMLPGWPNSRGACVEHDTARSLGMLIYEAEHLRGLVDGMPVLPMGVLYAAPERHGKIGAEDKEAA